MSLPNVLVIGMGGVGTMSAYTLAYNKKANVSIVVRSNPDKIAKQGFVIDSCSFGNQTWIPEHIYEKVEDAQGEYFDFIILTTKNLPDGPITCEEILKPVMKKGTTVILIQNGIDIEKPMLKAYPDNIFLSGVSLIGSTKFDNVVKQVHKEVVKFGAFKANNLDKPSIDASISNFRSIYQTEDDKNSILLDEDVELTRWEKLLYNAVFNTITAVVDLDITRCQINDANKTLFVPAMKEIYAIAASAGYNISPDSLERLLHISDGLFYTPSMAIDKQKNQLMEIQTILGNPLKVAESNNVAAPTLSMVYNLLKMIQFKIKQDIGLINLKREDFLNESSDNFPEIFQKSYS